MNRFNPLAPFLDTVDGDYVQKITTYQAAGTISAGDWVVIDPTVTTHGAGRHVIRMPALTSSTTAGARCVGVALRAASSGDKVDVAGRGSIVANANVTTGITADTLLMGSGTAGRAAAIGGVLQHLLAAGTTLTNTTTATAMASATIPANTLTPGKSIFATFAVQVLAVAANDTFRVRLFLGHSSLSGTNLVTVAAEDVEANDIITGWLRIDAQTSGEIIYGQVTSKGGPEAATADPGLIAGFFGSTSLTRTTAALLEIEGTWGAAAAGNQAAVIGFRVVEEGTFGAGNVPIGLCLETAASNAADVLVLAG